MWLGRYYTTLPVRLVALRKRASNALPNEPLFNSIAVDTTEKGPSKVVWAKRVGVAARKSGPRPLLICPQHTHHFHVERRTMTVMRLSLLTYACHTTFALVLLGKLAQRPAPAGAARGRPETSMQRT